MVDISDLAQINKLNGELIQAVEALQAINNGDRIVQVSFGRVEGDRAIVTAGISALDMTYPAQMAQTIKASLEQRAQHLRDELAALGLSGDKPGSDSRAKGAKP